MDLITVILICHVELILIIKKKFNQETFLLHYMLYLDADYE